MTRSSPAPEPAPTRPALRPGLRVVRRDDHHLQVGEHPDQRLVLPDTPEVRGVLAAVEAGRRPPDSRWYAALRDHGLVADREERQESLGLGLPRAAVLAAYAREERAGARLAARAAARVALAATPPWRSPALRLLAGSGLRLAEAGERPTVVVLLGDADAAHLDDLLRREEPYLLVGSASGRITVGPLVAPGLTACHRCLLVHRCERDPGHATVRAQAGSGADALDPALVHLALAWAVRDVVAFVEGDLPRLWSATVTVDPGLLLERQEWPRHPGCGCAWGERLADAG